MLIFSVIARGSTVLAEYAASTGNFQEIAAHILEKIPKDDSKMTFVYERYLFHYIKQNGVTYMCMAGDEFGRRIPFAFLEDVSTKFESAFGRDRIETAISYGLNEFSKTLASRMEFYSSGNPEADRIRGVQREIQDVRDIAVANIEKVMERGDRIDILVDKTDSLNQASFAFKKRSTALRRQMYCARAAYLSI
ncbi:MAG: hypothetical protein SGCHY_002881 [Lobulomycetales sp.]